jgi:hypothetical protein
MTRETEMLSTEHIQIPINRTVGNAVVGNAVSRTMMNLCFSVFYVFLAYIDVDDFWNPRMDR